MKILVIDERPYWFDIETLYNEYSAMFTEASGIAQTSGIDWVSEEVEASEDMVRKISHGSLNMVRLLRKG